MKKVLALFILVVVLVTGITGCSRADGESSGGPTVQTRSEQLQADKDLKAAYAGSVQGQNPVYKQFLEFIKIFEGFGLKVDPDNWDGTGIFTATLTGKGGEKHQLQYDSTASKLSSFFKIFEWDSSGNKWGADVTNKFNKDNIENIFGGKKPNDSTSVSLWESLTKWVSDEFDSTQKANEKDWLQGFEISFSKWKEDGGTIESLGGASSEDKPWYMNLQVWAAAGVILLILIFLFTRKKKQPVMVTPAPMAAPQMQTPMAPRPMQMGQPSNGQRQAGQVISTDAYHSDR